MLTADNEMKVKKAEQLKFWEKELSNLSLMKKIISEKIMMYQNNIAVIDGWMESTAKTIEDLKKE